MIEQKTQRAHGARERLAPLDRDDIRAALHAAIGEEVVGAFIRVNGEEGPWEATAGSAALDAPHENARGARKE